MKNSAFGDSIRVGKACNENWDEMAGNDRVRFCSHCDKSVNNISAMTPRKAAKLVMRSNGNLCIRYRVDPATNGPIFAPQLVKIAGRAGLAAGVLGASIAAAQPTFAQGSPRPVDEVRAEQIVNSDGTPAKIAGTVTDQQGAVIPFAVVTIVNKETGDSRWTNADAQGAYEFLDVTAGKYAIKIEAAGFQTLEQQDVSVSDGSHLRRNVQLEIPQMEAVVQIGGDERIEEVVMVGLMIADYEPRNALVQAVLNDDFDEVKLRVSMRGKVNVRDKAYDGLSPLHAAVQNGNVEIARFLLERGAKVNIRDYEKRTPIMMLDEDASPEMVQLLVSYGAKPKLVDKEKNGALHHAASNGVDPEIVRSLINFGFNINAVNKKGESALMVAAENDEEEIASILLQSGADINVRARDGRSAVDVAGSDSLRSVLQSYGGIGNQ